MENLLIMNYEKEEEKQKVLSYNNIRMHNEIKEYGKQFEEILDQRMDITFIKVNAEKIFNELILREEILSNLSLIKEFDDITYKHSIKVAMVSILIGLDMRLSDSELYNLGFGAFLHDIGKIFIEKKY